ncbi:MAG: pre-mRNA-splicing factor cwc22, partial [Paramarteilia canceri]
MTSSTDDQVKTVRKDSRKKIKEHKSSGRKKSSKRSSNDRKLKDHKKEDIKGRKDEMSHKSIKKDHYGQNKSHDINSSKALKHKPSEKDSLNHNDDSDKKIKNLAKNENIYRSYDLKEKKSKGDQENNSKIEIKPKNDEEQAKIDNEIKKIAEKSEKIDINVLNHESELLQSKAGGVYLPPFKLKEYQSNITDKSTAIFQRLHWIALKKSINGLMNKVNADNVVNIIQELLAENIVRARGLLIRALLNSQQFSPAYTNIYAAIISVINTK